MALRAEGNTGKNARILALVDRDLPVDDHVFHAGGEHVRMVVSRLVGDCRSIEHDHVRVISGTEQTAIGQTQGLRSQRAGRMDGERQRDDLFFADI